MRELMLTFERVAGIIAVGIGLFGLLRGLGLWFDVVNLDRRSPEYRVVVADMNTIRCLLGKPQQNELTQAEVRWAGLLYIIPAVFALILVAIAAVAGLPVFE